MTKPFELALAVLRIFYAAFFLIVAIYSAWALLSGEGNPFTGESGPGTDFQTALLETGFVIPIMLVFYAIGGALMLVRRSAPLGLVILAPFVAVIVPYHLFLDGSVLWALFWLFATLVLAWRFRRAYRPMLRWR